MATKHRGPPGSPVRKASDSRRPYDKANTAELEELRAELKREGAETHPPNRVFLCNGNVSENVSLNEQVFLIIIYALFCTGNNTCNQ